VWDGCEEQMMSDMPICDVMMQMIDTEAISAKYEETRDFMVRAHKYLKQYAYTAHKAKSADQRWINNNNGIILTPTLRVNE
jgi:hypothetical protein